MLKFQQQQQQLKHVRNERKKSNNFALVFLIVRVSLNKILFFIIDIYCIEIGFFFGSFFFLLFLPLSLLLLLLYSFYSHWYTGNVHRHTVIGECMWWKSWFMCGFLLFCLLHNFLTLLHFGPKSISRARPVTSLGYDRSLLCTYSLLLKKPLAVL